MAIFRYLKAGIAALSIFVLAQTASAVVIFNETFDGGALDNPADWSLSSSTTDGRIAFTASPTAAAGTAMWMDDTTFGGFNRNEAILTVDLTACGSVCWLNFFFAEANDESHFLPLNFVGSVNGDGVSISDDGTNWHTILNATQTDFGVWTPAMFDLAAEAAGSGMTLGSNFQIKFQQFDNFPRNSDGRGYDEIVIESHVPEPATLTLFVLGLAGLGFARRKKA